MRARPSSDICLARGIWIPPDWTFPRPALEELLAVSPAAWQKEFEAVGAYLAEFGDRVPPALHAELEDAMARVRIRPDRGSRPDRRFSA